MSSREESSSLKLLFYVSLITFFFEILSMFVRHHFNGGMVFAGVFSIFVLGYFDKHFIRTLLVSTGVNVILDLFWLIMHSDVSIA